MVKFKLKSELDVYKALQKYGKLSDRSLSKKTGISPTTIQTIYKRIRKRKFFDVKACPDIPQFSEIPIAFLGFTGIHPVRLKHLKESDTFKNQMRIFAHNDNDIFLFLMDQNSNKLTELIFKIMELLQARPVLHVITPIISQCNLAIPDDILEAVYGKLPDKRRK